MCESEDDALSMIDELGFPPVFQEIWRRGEPSRFCLHWHKPTFFWEYRDAIVELSPRLRSSVPLLEAFCDQIVLYEPATGKYLAHYFDELDVREIGDTYQQFLTSLFVDFGYAGLDDLVEEVSAQFRYNLSTPIGPSWPARTMIRPRTLKRHS